MSGEEKKHSVLIIDDDPAIRSLVAQFLGKMPLTIVEAEDGDKGLALLATQPIDLVITDIMMPSKDGVETIIEIQRRFPEIKIIAMSGGGRIKNMDFLEFAGTVGAHATLTKPFRRQDLLSTVAELLK